MQLSFEWEFSFWSCSAGPVRRIWTVKRSTPAGEHFRPRPFPFRNDDDGRRADRQTRILIGRALDAAGHHQADMDAVGHAVGLDDIEQPRLEGVAGEADVDPQHLRPVPQTVEMAIEEGDAAIDQPQALPDAVAEHEARIKHGHLRRGPGHERPVDADQDRVIARVAEVILRTGGEWRVLRHDSLQLSGAPPCRPAASTASVADACSDACGASGLAFAALLGQGGRSGRMSPQRAGEQKHEARSGHRMAGRSASARWRFRHGSCSGNCAGCRTRACATRSARFRLAAGSWPAVVPPRSPTRRSPGTTGSRSCISAGGSSWRFVGLTSFVTYAIAHNLGASVFSGARHPLPRLFDPGLERGEVGLLVAFCSFTFGLGRGDARRPPAASPPRPGRALRRARRTVARRGGGARPDRRPLPLFVSARSCISGPFKVGGFQLTYPRPPVATRQLLAGPLELVGAAGIIFFALPAAQPGLPRGARRVSRLVLAWRWSATRPADSGCLRSLS